MKLRAMGFSPNGRADLRGTLVAVDDNGEPLGVEHTRNFSDIRERNRFIRVLVEDVGINKERATTAVNQALKIARAASGSATGTTPSSTLHHDRPVIEVTGRYLREIADASWKVLSDANAERPRYLCFGNVLCSLEGNPLQPRILSPIALRGHLDRLADYVRVNKDSAETPSRPPKDLLEDMLAFASPPVPELRAVINAPTFDPDDRLVIAEGYDATSGLYLTLGSLSLPPVPEYPSEFEMREAKRHILDELLVDFPFASDADQAHALAVLITAIVRPMIQGPTPLFLIEAPSPGSGKDLLADVISIAATGGSPPAMTEGHDDDEWRKRLTAKLITAPSIVLIDNVRRKLDSGSLSAALERPIWEDRYLGQSRVVAVPISCTWLCTANNPSLSDEIARWVARIRINAQMERPWERTNFKHPKLKEWTKGHRGELLWAVQPW